MHDGRETQEGLFVDEKTTLAKTQGRKKGKNESKAGGNALFFFFVFLLCVASWRPGESCSVYSRLSLSFPSLVARGRIKLHTGSAALAPLCSSPAVCRHVQRWVELHVGRRPWLRWHGHPASGDAASRQGCSEPPPGCRPLLK